METTKKQKSAAQTQTAPAATMQPATNRSAQQPATFEVRKGTVGRVEGIGLVLVVTQPVDSKADMLEILAAAGKAETDQYIHGDIDVTKVQKVYNDKGSARKEFPDHAKDGDESVLNMARRLAGQEVPQQRQSQQRENPWVRGETGRDDARLKVVAEPNGNLYAYGTTFSNNPLGTKPLEVTLKALEAWTEPVLDDEGKPTGTFATVARYVIVTK